MNNYCISGFLIPVNIQKVPSKVIMSDDCEGVEEDVQLLQDAVFYATEKRYRDGSEKNWKRSMRRKAGRFRILNGELLYIKKDKKEVNVKYFPILLYYQIMCRLDTL